MGSLESEKITIGSLESETIQRQ